MICPDEETSKKYVQSMIEREILLTVVIPTFNRRTSLLQVLNGLADSIKQSGRSASIETIILDNCSEYDVRGTIETVLPQFDSLTYERNVANIGMLGNILRCFEVGHGRYLWILGDDDVPVQNAVAIIAASIEHQPNAIFYNFGEPGRHARQQSEGLNGFLSHCNSFGHQVWISSGVYNRTEMLSCLRYGYAYSYNQMPHTSILIQRLRQDETGICVFEPFSVIANPGIDEQHWSHVNSAIAGGTWSDMPLDESQIKLLSSHLKGNILICGYLFCQFLLEAKRTGHWKIMRHCFGQYYHRSFVWNAPMKLVIKANCLRVAFLTPRISHAVMIFVAKLKYGSEFNEKLQSRLANNRDTRL